MKVMIIGATGLLGTALQREWKDDEVVGFGSANLDIRDAARVNEVVGTEQPNWIVLAAAYTDVDGCEGSPELAYSVNRDGAVNIADAATRASANLLFLSTDYVFDGRKTSPYEANDGRNPQSVYGRSKAEAEVGVLEKAPECCIVRTSWLFGMGRKCFPDTILKLAGERPVLDVVNDQCGCPTYSVDLAKAIITLCRNHARGIVHVTNTGVCSWFEFAQEIVRRAGLKTAVNPVSSAQMQRPAPRPGYSVLSAATLTPYGIQMPEWQDALRRYLEERQTGPDVEVDSPKQ